MKDLATKLRTLRDINGYKQEYVGHSVGLSQSAYSRIENGETGQISIDLLEKFAKLYEVTTEQLLGWDGNVSIGIVNNNQGVVVNHGTTHLHPPVDERIKELEAKVEMLLGLLKKEG